METNLQQFKKKIIQRYVIAKTFLLFCSLYKVWIFWIWSLSFFFFFAFPYLGPVWSSERCVLVTRHAVGGVRRLRCFTSWRTRYPFRDASPPTWTKLPSWGWRSAICAWTDWSNPVGSAEIKQEIVWCVAVVLSWLMKTQKWVTGLF